MFDTYFLTLIKLSLLHYYVVYPIIQCTLQFIKFSSLDIIHYKLLKK